METKKTFTEWLKWLREKGIEKWNDVPGWHGVLKVSTHGNVFNLITQKMQYQHDNGKGYKVVRVNIDNGIYRLRIHRLVAMAFIPNPENLEVVNHKDLNKSNNHVSNLEWCTYEDNTRHYHRMKKEGIYAKKPCN